ncbi:MAG: hypothetical protein JWM49_2015 [Microbacteriaceae bacterium]|nr:hypothetical protein [Microbacteriaceae bacterium]
MLAYESKIELPPVPANQAEAPVAVWSEPLTIDTYEPAAPDRYPQFLDSRVYQGSSGKVFPLPFHERIESSKNARAWQAVHLENDWMRVVILPELGGRIHIAYDKITGYDMFYRNNVIKPALVGLTGPWISGGVEFNWPQHHRPATYLPTDVAIERESDGSVTVWCSDHDPFTRMKGMHGIRLRPDSSAIEARVRLFNRSEETQTFLWWANVAAAVGDHYQSFFPTDVHFVADHAKRAVVSFPEVNGKYYGVDYPSRLDAEHPDADRLDWYRNIPVPTSYMVTHTENSFFGGYDHSRKAGFVHWADRSISPGKKQWTWGNAPFGHAWDINLTDTDGPYVELMAGVYTENQPDFAFLAPGETKTFSQFWYPISAIGPATQATKDAAIRVESITPALLRVGVSTSLVAEGASIEFTDSVGRTLDTIVRDIAPDAPVIIDWPVPDSTAAADIVVRVVSNARELVAHSWRAADAAGDPPASAVAPPAPTDIATTEELNLVAAYLRQYRHATRSPEPYWLEVLRRDPDDIRANIALGSRRYSAALYAEAAQYFERAIRRETAWAPTPASGESHYLLGLALRRLGRCYEAQHAFEKAAWDDAQSVAAFLALARLNASPDPERALDYASRALRRDAENLQLRALCVVLLRRLERHDEAAEMLEQTLRFDPLDQWSRDLAGLPASDDATILLDVGLEYLSVGAEEDANRLLALAVDANAHRPSGQVNVGSLAWIHRAALAVRSADERGAIDALAEATALDATNALPSRLDDIDALTAVASLDLTNPVVAAMLGSWYFDRGRFTDAIVTWNAGLSGSPDAATVALLHRNLGVAAYNVSHSIAEATRHFDQARAAAPDDPRLLFESDQLSARARIPAADRLAQLDARPDLVADRDDLTVERARLLTETGQPAEALSALGARHFQPWEGGEGIVLGAWDAASVALSREALARGDGHAALAAIEPAITPPASLGEARHPLATTADLHVTLGDAYAAVGLYEEATASWTVAANARGDFTDMATAAFTDRSAWSILALYRLGRRDEATRQLDAFARFIDEEAAKPAEIDYFATSLPTMLLFHDQLDTERDARIARLRSLWMRLRSAIKAPTAGTTDGA